MDDHGSRENGRHKPEQYRSVHAQWMIPQHQMKDHHTAQTIKLMAIIAERDSALNERDLALSEKRTAQAERDMAVFQRDAAIAERNNALLERENAIAALEYARENSINGSAARPGCATPHGTRDLSHHHYHHVPHSSSLDSSDSPYDHGREMNTSETLPSEGVAKTVNEKQTRKETKAEVVPSRKASKPRKNRRSNVDGEDLNRQVTVAEMNMDWRGQEVNGGDNTRDQAPMLKKHRKEWKAEGLGGLNEVMFDESSMPVPVCSCTGKYQPCYKWGNGGWQSACCTTTISMYPLPVMPNKRHSRVNGRKMSGTVFTKLISRLASEGHDLRVPVDLKDHWSKHGTNRYITIK